MNGSFFYLTGVAQDAAPWGSNRVLVFPSILDAAKVKRSLDSALDIFYQLKGRIVVEKTTGRHALIEADLGIEFKFQEISSDYLSELIRKDPANVELETHDVFDVCYPNPCPGVGWDPITMIYITVILPAEYTVVAVTTPHGICDGITTSRFLSCWNDITTKGHSDYKPFFRVKNAGLLSTTRLMETFPNDYLARKLSNTADADLQRLFARAVESHVRGSIRMDGPKLKELLKRVIAHIREQDSSQWITTSELVFGLIVAACLRIKGCSCFCSRVLISLRGRTKLFPDDNYMGNAFARPVGNITVDASNPEDTFSLVMRCSMALHGMFCSQINDERTLENYFYSFELLSQRPDLRESLRDRSFLQVLQAPLGFDFNSWKQFEDCFKYTFGSSTTAVYMGSTPKYRGLVVPRMCLLIPSYPDGSVTVLNHLTPEEADSVTSVCKELDVLIEPMAQ